MPKKNGLVIANDFSGTSLTRFYDSSSGTRATSGSTWGLRVTSGTVAAGQGCVVTAMSTGTTQVAGGGTLPIGGFVTLASQCYYQPTTGATSGEGAVVAGYVDETNGGVTPNGLGYTGNSFFGFKWVTSAGPTHTLYAISGDGTTLVNIALSPAVAVANNDLLLMAIKTPTSIKFYVNNVLLATSTTSIPTSYSTDNNYYSVAANNGALNAATVLNCGFISFRKDLEP